MSNFTDINDDYDYDYTNDSMNDDMNMNMNNLKKQKKEKSGSFQSMDLNKELLNGLNRMSYKIPTPVQRKTLPLALAGMDVVCMARTGSGKTAAFLLPLLQRLNGKHDPKGVRGVVLSPTRELAMQTFRFAKDMSKFTDLRIISLIGGDPLDSQFDALASHPDIIIATPGRLMHMIREVKSFKLLYVQYLVFDEADRLFEMGFAEQLNEIVKQCPEERQTLLFSATMPKMIIQFSRAGLRDPQLVRLDTDTKMSEELRMAFFSVRSNEKYAALLYLVRTLIPDDQLTIIFCATKHHSEFIHALLNKVGIKSTVVYGSMDQDARSNNLRDFRKGEVNYMIVTDVAARGIDVPLLNNVINFHFPPVPKLFVHRCGRAARQGRIGFAFSLVEPDEMAYMMDVHSFLGIPFRYSFNPVEEGLTGDNPNETPHYNMETMTPKHIHMGLLPQDVLDEENEYLKTTLAADDVLRGTHKVSENGMMQYKRTRTEASREGLKQAKAAIKGNVVRTMHPLILGCDPSRCSSEIVEKQDFVRMLQTFRPKETVFESGIGTGSKVGQKVGKESKGVLMMKALRKVNASALERNKKTKNTVKDDNYDNDNSNENDINTWDEFEIQNDDFVKDTNNHNNDDDNNNEETSSKPRISKTERKKLKRQGLSSDDIQELATRKANLSKLMSDTINVTSSTSNNEAKDYKDRKFFMKYGTEDERATFEEQSLQPMSGLRSSETIMASQLESSFLDVLPEEALEMNKKRRILRWDAKKRKFVKQSLEEMSAVKGNKRIRSESGISQASTRPQGELYEKWKKKSKREIQTGNTDDDDDLRNRPNFKVNRNVKEELRSATEIRKLHQTKSKNKLKNMEKEKRASVEKKMKKTTYQNKKLVTNDRRRKGKVIIRM